MNNIFKDAYFGKAYKTRDGRKAIYHMYDSVESSHFLILDGSDEVCCDDEGIDLGDAPEYDIVSEWEDPINEEELYNIADLWVCDNGVENSRDGIEAFIAGYNFAKKGE